MNKQQWQVPLIIWVFALFSTGCAQVVEYLPPLPQIPTPTAEKPSVSPQSAQTAKFEAQVREQINQVRQENNLNALKNNEQLAEVARNYSRQMAEKNFFSHTGADGSTLQDRVQGAGIIYWVVGENLFKSKNISQPVSPAVEGWMKSPGHRANILRPVFNQTGVGVWRQGNTYYITQLFMRG